jgi:hypothetical protein
VPNLFSCLELSVDHPLVEQNRVDLEQPGRDGQMGVVVGDLRVVASAAGLLHDLNVAKMQKTR